MDVKTYLLMHLFGMFSVMVGIAGLAYREALGGPAQPNDKKLRMMALGEHGFGLLLMLVSGFGLLAKQGIHGIPGWTWAKIGIWVYLAAAPFLIRRFFAGDKALGLWISLPFWGLVAGYLAITKGF